MWRGRALLLCLLILPLALAGPPKPRPPRIFLADGRDLEKLKKRVAEGDKSITSAVATLRAAAQQTLKAGPFTVVNKPKPPPSGDKHDYVSMAPYFWPNPDKK